jgi:hypothetical protein
MVINKRGYEPWMLHRTRQLFIRQRSNFCH